MNDSRSIRVPAEHGGSDIGRKALWVIREVGLPAIVKACVSCRSTRHHPTGKFRVNANGKLLDVWMLICCELCGRTSKIPIHERICVQALKSEPLLMFENNDPAMVRDLAMDGTLAGKYYSRGFTLGIQVLPVGYFPGRLARRDVTVSDDVPGASTGAENYIFVVRGGRGPSWMCDETRGSHGRAGQHKRCRGVRRAGGWPGQVGPGPGAGAAAQRGDRVGVRDRAVAGNAGELLGDRGSGRS